MKKSTEEINQKVTRGKKNAGVTGLDTEHCIETEHLELSFRFKLGSWYPPVS